MAQTGIDEKTLALVKHMVKLSKLGSHDSHYSRFIGALIVGVTNVQFKILFIMCTITSWSHD